MKKKLEFDRDEFFICLFILLLIVLLAGVQAYLVGFTNGKYEDKDVVILKKNCKDSIYQIMKGAQ